MKGSKAQRNRQPRCSVCRHDRRAEIDSLLAAGAVSYRDMARQFRVSKDAVARHRPHIAAALTAAVEAGEQSEAESLLAKIGELEREARRLGRLAEGSGDYRAALTGVREALRVLEFFAAVRAKAPEPEYEYRFSYTDPPPAVVAVQPEPAAAPVRAASRKRGIYRCRRCLVQVVPGAGPCAFCGSAEPPEEI